MSLVGIAKVGILPIRLITPLGFQSSICVIMSFAVLIVALLVLHSTKDIVGQAGGCHQSECAKHRAYSEGIRGCLSIKEELGSDNVANSCSCQSVDKL